MFTFQSKRITTRQVFKIFIPSLICLYICFAFLPFPAPITIGLDPSWQYAITRASLDKLQFGQDLVFTFGPFGYLMTGSSEEGAFWHIFLFKIFVHLIFFSSVAIHLFKYRRTASFYCLILTTILIFSRGISTDYVIAFSIFLLTNLFIDRIGKTNISLVILSGAVAGFLSTTKFSLGVQSILLLVPYLPVYVFGGTHLSNVWKEFDYKNVQKVLRSFFDAIILFSLSFLWTGLILITYLNAFALFSFSILISLIISSAIGRLFSTNGDTSRILYRLPRLLYLHKFIVVFSSISIAIFFKEHSFIDYFLSSLEVSSGYSSAMSLIGSPWELSLGIISLCIGFIFLVSGIKSITDFSVSSSAFLFLWFSFKHGFVRQDSHTIIYMTTAAFIFSYMLIRENESFQERAKGLRYSSLSFILAILLFNFTFPGAFLEGIPNSSFLPLSTHNVLTKLETLFNPVRLKETTEDGSELALSKAMLSASTLAPIENETVDIVPWDISMVAANNLQWNPRPIFQSYAAFTSGLDKRNAESIRQNPSDFILYEFKSIDGRHPFFDEPETFFNILCNYKDSKSIGANFTLTGKAKISLLEKRSKDACLKVGESEKIESSWDADIDVSDFSPSIVRANIEVNYTFLGKIYKTIFRAPPTHLIARYIDGSETTFRFIPENSSNGLIVNYLPKYGTPEALLFLSNRPKFSSLVSSFRLENLNSLLYKKEIGIEFSTYILKTTPQQFSQHIDQLFELDSQIKRGDKIELNLKQNIGQYAGNIDSVKLLDVQNSKGQELDSPHELTLEASGWSIDLENRKSNFEGVSILLTIDESNEAIAVSQTGSLRSDIATYFTDKIYLFSGWHIKAHMPQIDKGSHLVNAWAYSPETQDSVFLDSFEIVVE